MLQRLVSESRWCTCVDISRKCLPPATNPSYECVSNRSESIHLGPSCPEFAIYGPPGLDVGCLLSSYLLAAVLAAGRQPEAGASDTCRRLRSAVREIWEASAPHASGRQPASHTRRPLSAGGIPNRPTPCA